MRPNTVMGLLFPNMHDEALMEFTGIRAMGSIPFGGRYRLIDFPLSNMVNSGVTRVGIVTKSNYKSLMDHIGSGKAWDLSRKREGLYFLPPFGTGDDDYNGRISSLAGALPFLRSSKEEYVILSDCHVVGNIDYRKLVNAHIQSGAEITVACVSGNLPKNLQAPVVHTDASGRIIDMRITDHADGDVTYGIGLYVLSRELLLQLIDVAISRQQSSFEWDILQRQVSTRRFHVYMVPEYLLLISSLEGYFAANRELLKQEVRSQLFSSKHPIYTKVHDTEPALYGLHADVDNSLIADGCNIQGTVKNSILFRNVHVGRDAVVDNCIIMQGGVIGGRTNLQYVITDKDVCIREGRSLQGCADYPVAIRKNTML